MSSKAAKGRPESIIEDLEFADDNDDILNGSPQVVIATNRREDDASTVEGKEDDSSSSSESNRHDDAVVIADDAVLPVGNEDVLRDVNEEEDDEFDEFTDYFLEENDEESLYNDEEDYDSDDSDDPFYQDINNSKWKYHVTDSRDKIKFIKDPCNDLLVKTFTNEMEIIKTRVEGRIQPDGDLLNEISSLFLMRVIPAWVEAANCGNLPSDIQRSIQLLN
jgi:hypothetical protein